MSRIGAVPQRRRLTLRLAMIAVVAVALLGSSPATALGAARSHIKVAIIVGPVGAMTDYYRGLADEAAAVARRSSDDVVTVYTPNATWPRVRRALQGASIVVYLGHGNGWPSPYRDAPFAPTQNGLGLNPVAGGGDEAHQYFGERYLSTSVDLAPGAVVILSHLCYASGNPEPGGPDPTLSVARQRADNYAAGWLAAGAAAVIAEAHGGPAEYVDAVFHRDATFERIWRSAPTFHDHVLTFDSARTDGARVMLDPDRASRGYFRSLVTRPGAQAADVRDGEAPPPPPAGVDLPDAERISLAAQGATFGTPSLAGTSVTSGRSTLALPLVGKTRNLLPDQLSVGARWDLLLADGPDPAGQPASTEPPGSSVPAASATPTPSPQPVSSAAPTPDTSPGSTPAPASPDPAGEPPQIQLVAPELPGTVVVADATVKATRLTVAVTLPERTGLYRLSTTLHDRDGVAFDAATQALIPALIVRVTGPLWASYAVADTIGATPGAPIILPIRLANTGSESWSGSPVDGEGVAATGVAATGGAATESPVPATLAPETPTTSGVERRPARLVARWIALDRMAVGPLPPSDVNGPPVYLTPGASAVFPFDLTAPSEPGHYLLVIDVVLLDRGSLAANGVPPGLVRVIVEPSSLMPSPDAIGPAD